MSGHSGRRLVASFALYLLLFYAGFFYLYFYHGGFNATNLIYLLVGLFGLVIFRVGIAHLRPDLVHHPKRA